MLDISAFPIAVALTLWDAVPIYLSVGLALSILLPALLSRKALHRFWISRERLGIEGVVYLTVIEPRLAPVLAVASVVMLAVIPGASQSSEIGEQPLKALAARTGEIVSPLIVASAVAALIKLSAPDLPASIAFQLIVAIGIGIAVGNRSGAAAIPAAAIAVHYGGFAPAALCITIATARPLLAGIASWLSESPLHRR